MDYTVQQLARLSGVTARTIRYYDQIGLLKPKRISGAGHRIYGQQQLDTLQQILFYRELDFPLERIAEALAELGFDRQKALTQHRVALQARRDRLSLLIQTIDDTLKHQKEGTHMSDAQKFEGFKSS